MTNRIDIADIAARALAAAETILAQELPYGRREGHEWVALNPTRADSNKGSFKVNIAKGSWADFATGDKGGDLVSLYAYLHGLTQIEAATQMAEMYQLGGSGPAPVKKAKKEREQWTPLPFVPDDAPPPPKEHRHYGPPHAAYTYFDNDGETLGYVWRIQHSDGSKDYLPLVWCESKTGKRDWQFRGFAEPRPLYGLDRLAKEPWLPVLVVEGEKCADAAKLTLGGSMVVVTWPGGANAVKKADWTPLAGRIVVVWPDNDLPGFRAARDVCQQLENRAQKLTLLTPLPNKPAGWDVADAVDEGISIGNYIIVSHTDPEEFIANFVTPFKEEKAVKPGEPKKKERDKDDFLYNDAGFFETSDFGDACRLARLHGENIRYNHKPFGAWFIWIKNRWVEDKSNRIYSLVDDMIRAMYREAGKIGGDEPDDKAKERRRFIVKHTSALENMHKQRQLVAKAETLQSLSIAESDLDRKNYLFVCDNTTLDLSMETGAVVARDHSQLDYLTRGSSVVYNPEALCPHWTTFLDEIFAGDDVIIECVARMVGYTLTGDFSEERLFFAYGTGANGKSVFFNVMQMLFGDYYDVAPPEMIQQDKFSTHPTDVADLKGKRFVVASELEENKRLMEGKVKMLTGADQKLKARRMREDWFEFPPTHKLWMFGNHKPKIYGNDYGIWRRIILIPFGVTITAEKRKPMRVMLELFRGELSGILNWALGGYADYCDRGFAPPKSMNELVEEYRFDEDIVAQFISENCVLEPTIHTLAVDIYKVYSTWCEESGERALTARRFNNNMRERGFTVRPGGQNKTNIYGVGLRYNEPSNQTSLGDTSADF